MTDEPLSSSRQNAEIHVLLVEDDPTSSALQQQLLRSRGYTVHAAGTAEAAQALLAREKRISLAVVDWLLPGASGLDLTRHIRTTDNDDHYTYVILVTVKDSEEAKISGLEAGADDYITKPYLHEEYLARISIAERIIRYQKDQADLVTRLQELAVTDSLTKILNQTTVLKRLAEELERSFRDGAPLGMIMLDVDRFKQTNDVCGHQAGDAALKLVVTALKKVCRNYDVLGRYGGDEFIAILPGARVLQAEKIAQRVRNIIEQGSFTVGENKCRTTVSIGCTACELDGDVGVNDMIASADRALYEAKSAGGNRVVSRPVRNRRR